MAYPNYPPQDSYPPPDPYSEPPFSPPGAPGYVSPPPGPHPRRSQAVTGGGAGGAHVGFQLQDNPVSYPTPGPSYGHLPQGPSDYAFDQQQRYDQPWNTPQPQQQYPYEPQPPYDPQQQQAQDPFRDDHDEPQWPLLSGGGGRYADQGYGQPGQGPMVGGFAAQQEEESQIRYGRIPQRQPRRYKTVKRELGLSLRVLGSWRELGGELRTRLALRGGARRS